MLSAGRVDLLVFPQRQAFSGQDPFETRPAIARGILHRGQAGAEAGAVSTEDGPGRSERPLRNGFKRRCVSRLCQPDRQATARQPEKDSQGRNVRQQTLGDCAGRGGCLSGPG